jgi:hypothetical protein
MTLINNYSYYTKIYFLKKQSDATSRLRRFSECVNTKTGRYPHSVRSDQGGEFISNEWITYCFEKGIIYEIAAVYSPKSNGIAGGVNLTLSNMCRLSLAGLLPNL